MIMPEEAINRMTALNEAILEVEDLNENLSNWCFLFFKVEEFNF